MRTRHVSTRVQRQHDQPLPQKDFYPMYVLSTPATPRHGGATDTARAAGATPARQNRRLNGKRRVKVDKTVPGATLPSPRRDHDIGPLADITEALIDQQLPILENRAQQILFLAEIFLLHRHEIERPCPGFVDRLPAAL
jgi:hypothetical protein